MRAKAFCIQDFEKKVKFIINLVNFIHRTRYDILPPPPTRAHTHPDGHHRPVWKSERSPKFVLQVYVILCGRFEKNNISMLKNIEYLAIFESLQFPPAWILNAFKIVFFIKLDKCSLSINDLQKQIIVGFSFARQTYNYMQAIYRGNMDERLLTILINESTCTLLLLDVGW